MHACTLRRDASYTLTPDAKLPCIVQRAAWCHGHGATGYAAPMPMLAEAIATTAAPWTRPAQRPDLGDELRGAIAMGDDLRGDKAKGVRPARHPYLSRR